MRLSSIATLTALLLVVACSSERKAAPSKVEPTPAPTDEAKPAPRPAPTLAATAADKLGTAPAGLGLALGAKAPDARLVDVTGQEVSLASLYARGATVVVFYRGGWCPFCNIQLHDLGAAKAQFDAKGLQLVAISVDLPNEEAKTQAQSGVAFPMLSDPKLVAHQAFNVVQVNTPEEKAKLAGYGLDLAKYSGEDHGNFAVPSIFVIDAAGVVRFVHVDLDYKTRPSPAQILAAADAALAAK